MKIKKFKKFLGFVMNYKLSKLVSKMTTEELVNLYQTYSPLCFTEGQTVKDKLQGELVVYVVVEELKKRHPTNLVLQNYNYHTDLHLI